MMRFRYVVYCVTHTALMYHAGNIQGESRKYTEWTALTYIVEFILQISDFLQVQGCFSLLPRLFQFLCSRRWVGGVCVCVGGVHLTPLQSSFLLLKRSSAHLVAPYIWWLSNLNNSPHFGPLIFSSAQSPVFLHYGVERVGGLLANVLDCKFSG